jgi:hypothetical protein
MYVSVSFRCLLINTGILLMAENVMYLPIEQHIYEGIGKNIVQTSQAVKTVKPLLTTSHESSLLNRITLLLNGRLRSCCGGLLGRVKTRCLS